MRVLAIDYGLSRTGIAVSDVLGMIAKPLDFIPSRNEEKLFAALSDLINDIKPIKIIVGLPQRTDMKDSDMSQKVVVFADKVREMFGIETELRNEMFTTVIASKKLHENEKNAKKQKKLIDSAAAAVLLQEYLDSKK